MSETVKKFYDELYPSDIPLENLDEQLRIWVAQFVENALESNSKQIEVRFFNNGAEGFDVIDDGEGIKEEDFEVLPECLDERFSNEIYKTRSLGYKGEAMFCLIKSSDVTIMSKHRQSNKAFLVKYDRDGQVSTKKQIQMEICGTIIEVRNIFEIDAGVASKYKQQIIAQYDSAMNYLNTMSMVLYHITLVVTAGKLIKKNTKASMGMQSFEEKVKCKWQTHGIGNFLQNVRYILQNQFGTQLPDLPADLIKIDFDYQRFKVEIIMTRPQLDGKQSHLGNRTFHAYMNQRPIELQSRIRTIFFDIYHDFKVGNRSKCFAIVHFRTQHHEASDYEMKLQLDGRQIFFTSRQQAELWTMIRENIKNTFIKCVQESPEGQGLSRGEIERRMREPTAAFRPSINDPHMQPIKNEAPCDDYDGKIKVIKDGRELPNNNVGSMGFDFINQTPGAKGLPIKSDPYAEHLMKEQGITVGTSPISIYQSSQPNSYGAAPQIKTEPGQPQQLPMNQSLTTSQSSTFSQSPVKYPSLPSSPQKPLQTPTATGKGSFQSVNLSAVGAPQYSQASILQKAPPPSGPPGPQQMIPQSQPLPQIQAQPWQNTASTGAPPQSQSQFSLQQTSIVPSSGSNFNAPSTPSVAPSPAQGPPSAYPTYSQYGQNPIQPPSPMQPAQPTRSPGPTAPLQSQPPLSGTPAPLLAPASPTKTEDHGVTLTSPTQVEQNEATCSTTTPQSVQLKVEKTDEEFESEEGESELEEIDQAKLEEQKKLRESLDLEYKAFLDLGFYEFVSQTYSEPAESIKQLMRGRHEPYSSLLISIVKSKRQQQPAAESTKSESPEKASPSKQDCSKFDMDYYIDLTSLMDKVKYLEKKQFSTISKIPVSLDNSSPSKGGGPKFLSVVVDSELKAFFFTTEDDLAGDSHLFRGITLLDFNGEKARRLGYKRLKRTQLKYNNEYKQMKKALRKNKPDEFFTQAGGPVQDGMTQATLSSVGKIEVNLKKSPSKAGRSPKKKNEAAAKGPAGEKEEADSKKDSPTKKGTAAKKDKEVKTEGGSPQKKKSRAKRKAKQPEEERGLPAPVSLDVEDQPMQDGSSEAHEGSKDSGQPRVISFFSASQAAGEDKEMKNEGQAEGGQKDECKPIASSILDEINRIIDDPKPEPSAEEKEENRSKKGTEDATMKDEEAAGGEKVEAPFSNAPLDPPPDKGEGCGPPETASLGRTVVNPPDQAQSFLVRSNSENEMSSPAHGEITQQPEVPPKLPVLLQQAQLKPKPTGQARKKKVRKKKEEGVTKQLSNTMASFLSRSKQDVLSTAAATTAAPEPATTIPVAPETAATKEASPDAPLTMIQAALVQDSQAQGGQPKQNENAISLEEDQARNKPKEDPLEPRQHPIETRFQDDQASLAPKASEDQPKETATQVEEKESSLLQSVAPGPAAAPASTAIPLEPIPVLEAQVLPQASDQIQSATSLQKDFPLLPPPSKIARGSGPIENEGTAASTGEANSGDI